MSGIQLLPKRFDKLVNQAVDVFWKSRSQGKSQGKKKQGGSRGNVISGKNLDGFLGVVKAVAKHCGIPDASVYTKGRLDLTLPGFYRPNKNWDVLIVHKCRLLAVLEFKSQVGSFGNNFNNRAEEAIGNAADLWLAFEKGAYDPSNHKETKFPAPDDPRAPFVGYLMLLQDNSDSTKLVTAKSRHYYILKEYRKASHADRYRLLCERLMEQKLYNAASLLLSSSKDRHRSLTKATDVKNLFAALAGHLFAAVNSP